jgi:UDP-N-acetylmuramoyl-tripeptide--D-alanyl-D-alanine ligase
LIGITGTNGKTTTKELLKTVLSQKYKVSATAGNYNNHIGVPLTILATTKDAEILIVEMGTNQPGDINKLCEIATVDHGLITNIGAGHLEKLGNLQGVLNEKRALFDHVKKRNKGTFFLNLADPYLNQLIEELGECIAYDQSFCSIGEITWSSDENGFLKYTLHSENENITGTTALVGDYNRENISVVITVADFFEVPIEAIIEGIASYVPSNMRSQIQKTERNTLIIDAYNANPSSVKAALRSFIASGVTGKNVILGDMLELGEMAEQWHNEILEMLSVFPKDQVVLVGPIYNRLAKNQFPAYLSAADLKASEKLDKWTNCEILIKASRGIGLEKILDQL